MDQEYSKPSETQPLFVKDDRTPQYAVRGPTSSTSNVCHDANAIKYERLGYSDHHSETYVVYTTRWYILTLFSLLYMLQAIAWNTWGPIADTVKVVLRWSEADINLCINWGPITFVVFGFFFSYILTVKGFRFAVLSSSLFFLSGSAVRCIPVGIDNIKWTANIGQFLIGLSAPILQSAGTQLSALWFPPHQRTTSTAISASMGCLGIGFSFLIGSNIVHTVPRYITAANITAGERESYFNSIMNLMYIECAMGAVVVITALLYFPDKPPTPPSVSATEHRESLVGGALTLIKSVQFWIPTLAYSLSTGVYIGWNTQLVVLFGNTLRVKQNVVGFIGLYANIAGTVGGLVFARLVDILGGHMKLVLLLLMFGLVGSCAWCVLLSMHYIAFNMASLYISCIAIGFFANASIPIYFEVTIEGMYPVSEGTITMIMTWFNNVWGMTFVLLPQIPGIGVTWLNWVFLGAVVVCIPLLLMYKERYKRLDLDTHDNKDQHSSSQK